MRDKIKARAVNTGREKTLPGHYSIRALVKRLILSLWERGIITPGDAVHLINKWRLWYD